MADSKRKKSNIFHRTLDLQLGCGCEVLRKVMDTKLNQMQITLQNHIKKTDVQKIISNLKPPLFKEQKGQLYPKPRKRLFDTSLTTRLLLECQFNLSKDERDKIARLRELRNKLSHIHEPELADETIFNEAGNLLIELSKISGKPFQKLVKQKIADLQKVELFVVRSNAEIIKLRNEFYLTEILQNTFKGSSETLLVRYNLTKWSKIIPEHVPVATLLSGLTRVDVLTYVEKKTIEKHYNSVEQCNALVMKIVAERDENVLKLCKCIRKINPLLANVIEDTTDGGSETETTLSSLENGRIKSAIELNFEKDKNGTLSTEDLHMAVEDELGYPIAFSELRKVVADDFGLEPKDNSSVVALKWKPDKEHYFKERNLCFVSNEAGSPTHDDIINGTYEQFGDRLFSRVEQVKEGYGQLIRKAIVDECISPKAFVRLEENKLKACINKYMEGNKLTIGVMEELLQIQREILNEMDKINLELKGAVTRKVLRGFDKSEENNISCSNKVIKPPLGNLLVPWHEFRTTCGIHSSISAYIIKECIQFICACLNTVKNGTLHFGIEPLGNGSGKIIGMKPNKSKSALYLDMLVDEAIESCFPKYYRTSAKRCVRPFQEIQIDNENVVLEMDVCPSSLYAADKLITVHFPPKGKQSLSMFVFTIEKYPEIISVPPEKRIDTQERHTENIKERRLIESKADVADTSTGENNRNLCRRITGGSKYITDQYVPIIVLGKLTGTENEMEIRESIADFMPDVFRSAMVVFDFNQETRIQKDIEGSGRVVFKTRTADDTDLISNRNWLEDENRSWIYCNGKRDIELPEMETNVWLLKRANVVKHALADIRRTIPEERALLMFLFFESSKQDNPMNLIVEENMMTTFRNRCVVMASSEVPIYDVKKKILSRVTEGEDFESHFHCTMPWTETTKVLKSVSWASFTNDIHLPCHGGRITYLKAKQMDKLQWTDIEVISGKQCIELEQIDKQQLKDKRNEGKEHFYRGQNATWSNFYFEDQVGIRDDYTQWLKSALDKLRHGDSLVETQTILHHPGAGGSTAGRYLVWHLSQFEHRGTEAAYRCCVVKQITENTANQVSELMSFDEQHPTPVVVLVDNFNEDSVGLLRGCLHEKAYKMHLADNNIFYLIIIVKRVQVSYSAKPTEYLLAHRLSSKEQLWFEKKYKELEDAEEIDVNTLISFNVMRKDFDKEYIDELVSEFFKDVKKSEVPVLKCLSLVNSFDRDSVIPRSVFDCMMSGKQSKTNALDMQQIIENSPVGLAFPRMYNRARWATNSLWNVNVTEAFSLLIKLDSCKYSNTRTGSPDYPGVTMISHAVARSVLHHIMKKESTNLPAVIRFVLQLVSDHVSKQNPMSEEFVRIVSSLFKLRKFLTEEGETREMFADMIMHLTDNGNGEESEVVVSLMKECIDITKDAMVRQQLSQIHINMKNYDEAEKEIKFAIEMQPNNLYLLDTYGQIYFSKMENLTVDTCDNLNRISDEDAANIVHIALRAIEKFRQGQNIAYDEGADNTSCYSMEVKTILCILESFQKFGFYTTKKDFLDFLNKTDYTPKSFVKFTSLCDLSDLKRDLPVHRHAEESLRFLEERDYQIKRKFYIVTSEGKGKKLLLNLKERFERFYGSEADRESYQFNYGIGLKSLMQVRKKDPIVYKKRLDDAVIALQKSTRSKQLKRVDKRDLLFYLGNEIIVMSERGAETNGHPMSKDKYQSLIEYSQRLLEIEEKSERRFMEAYLYYVILNWPSDTRENVEYLCRPEKLQTTLKRWEESFEKNHNCENRKALPVPKTYFHLGNGPMGCDVVDFSLIEKKWREKAKTKGQNVQDDHIWEKSFVKKILKRIKGKMNEKGTSIYFETKYQYWKYEFNIGCLQSCTELCNRRVSFILIFTTAGPKATDIIDATDGFERRPIDDDGPSSLETRAMGHIDDDGHFSLEARGDNANKTDRQNQSNDQRLARESGSRRPSDNVGSSSLDKNKDGDNKTNGASRQDTPRDHESTVNSAIRQSDSSAHEARESGNNAEGDLTKPNEKMGGSPETEVHELRKKKSKTTAQRP